MRTGEWRVVERTDGRGKKRSGVEWCRDGEKVENWGEVKNRWRPECGAGSERSGVKRGGGLKWRGVQYNKGKRLMKTVWSERNNETVKLRRE